MAIERGEFIKILEDSFSAYYDIVPMEREDLPLVFRGDYKKLDERYWLTKSIPIWSNETGEFAYVFSAPRFDPALAERCASFAWEDGIPRVKPHKEHHHTDIKVVLIADRSDADTRSAVQKLSNTKSYHHSFWGYSNLLTALVDMEEGAAFTNKAGRDLDKYFRKLFDVRKEEG